MYVGTYASVRVCVHSSIHYLFDGEWDGGRIETRKRAPSARQVGGRRGPEPAQIEPGGGEVPDCLKGSSL